MVYEQGESGKLNIKKYILIASLTWAFFILVLLLFFSLEYFSCGDGTSYDKCSENKPYFCSKGNLVPDSNLCGCPLEFDSVGGKCFSEYSTNSKLMVLNYSLKNKNREINFTIYEGFYDYISKIPRSIDILENPNPSMDDFKSKMIDNELQRVFLMPLVVEIQNNAKKRENQAMIAVSLVQNIPYDKLDKNISILSQALNSRYPYEVIYDNKGVCGEKSNLLAFLLKEIGYDVVIFHFQKENHEAVGVRCSSGDFEDTGYCIFDSTSEYSYQLESFSYPEIIYVSKGFSL